MSSCDIVAVVVGAEMMNGGSFFDWVEEKSSNFDMASQKVQNEARCGAISMRIVCVVVVQVENNILALFVNRILLFEMGIFCILLCMVGNSICCVIFEHQDASQEGSRCAHYRERIKMM